MSSGRGGREHVVRAGGNEHTRGRETGVDNRVRNQRCQPLVSGVFDVSVNSL